MKREICIAALLLIPAGASFAYRQEKKATDAAAAKDDPMMMKMKEYGMAGPAHKVLDTRVGKWSWEMKTFEPGKATPTTTTGTSDVKWIMDGRFIEETVSCNYMGAPFQGRGTTGYDNIKKKYVHSWLDNMGTGLHYAEASYDAGAKTFTFMGESPDPMAWKFVKSRGVEKWTDNDHFMGQSFKTGADGKEFMDMEFHYTRAK